MVNLEEKNREYSSYFEHFKEFPHILNDKHLIISFVIIQGLPYSSVGKESACNAGDPGLIPGSGRAVREGIGYPLQYSWASLVAQLVKNLPAMQETWVRSWVGKIPWRRERLPTPVFWPGEFHGQRSHTRGRKESDTTEQLSLSLHIWPVLITVQRLDIVL